MNWKFFKKMKKQQKKIFQRLLNGQAVPFNDSEYSQIGIACNETRKLLLQLNNQADLVEIRKFLSQIINSEISETTTVFPPFQINYGKNTSIGNNVFINFNCTILDLGGVTIEDNVMIAPNVSILTEGHPVSSQERQTLTTSKIHIKKNVWVGANATILQGVTIGENSVVASGSVVSKDVPDNVIVGGIPAKIIKHI